MSIPRIHLRTSQDKENILDYARKKIMNNKTSWTTAKISNLLLDTLSKAEISSHMHESTKKKYPNEYKILLDSIREEYQLFSHTYWAPLILIQLSLGEKSARDNGMDEQSIIQDSNDILCNMILGCTDTSSTWCEDYDKMTSIFIDDLLNDEIRFQDLDMGSDTYDRSEIPRNFMNLKNMLYYECCDCDKIIYSQPNRSARECSMCLECWENTS